MIGTLLNDRYRIDAELGQGGMGTVYRAHDPMLDRDVAVKVVSAYNLGTEGRQRLLHEAQAIAKLNHPNIVAVYDAGEVHGAPYIVMELVEGQSLHESRPKDFKRIVAIAGQVCEALQHAHEQGIVHRDLKPENVLLARDGTAKLMDFGIARSVASRLTAEGQIIGTVFYLAPELALGQDFDGRADLYALGVMLYELTTGALPFAQGDPLAVISQHLHASVVPPRAKNSEVPPLLDSLIVRLMGKRPEDRPTSAAEVRQSLEREDLLEAGAHGERELALIDRIARGRFVGRERELGEAHTFWSKALAGEGQTLLISGEPGIGKTRLMRELATHVEVTGGRALVGTCYAEGGAPYAPFAQILRRTLGEVSQNGHALPEFVLADLLTLAPDLRPYYDEVPPNPPLEPQAEQQRLFENVVAFCSALSEQNPLLLVLDDAHWADSGSLSMLRHLARRLRHKRVLLMATYREVELDEARPFHEVMLDLNRERLAARMKLSRLSREETEALLAAIFEEQITPEFLDGIYRETEGNPFFIEEVCRTLVEEGKLSFENGRWHRPSMDELEIPQSVRVAIQSRVASMAEAHQEALRLAAVLGREFDYDTLAKASELDEDTLIEALEAAEHAQLIEEVGGKGVTFSFLHALIPATLEESVHTLRRRKLHRQAAAAIESLRPEDLEALAYHHGESGNESKALEYYARAGDRAAAAYANQEAERYYRAALGLVHTSTEEARLRSGLGVILSRLGQLQEAIEAWRTTVRVYQDAGNQARVAWCFARMSRAAWDTGDFAGGLDLSREGLRAVEGAPDSPELADLLHEAARAAYFNGVREEGWPLCQQALDIAERTGSVVVRAEALITSALLMENEFGAETARPLQQAIELCQAHGLLEQEARARNNLSVSMAIHYGDLEATRDHLKRARALARQTGSLASELFYGAAEAAWATTAGDLDYVNRELSVLGELYEQASRPGGAGLVLDRVRATLHRARGEWNEAAAAFRELRRTCQELGALQDLWGVNCELARALMETDDFEEAVAAVDEALDLAKREVADKGWPLCLKTMLEARRGDPDAARRALEEAEQEAARSGHAFDAIWVGMAKGHVLVAEGQWEAAWGAYQAALDLLDRHRMGWDDAWTLQQWARAHLLRGRPEDKEAAHALLERARAEFEGMGAHGYVERIRRQLEELDHQAA